MKFSIKQAIPPTPPLELETEAILLNSISETPTTMQRKIPEAESTHTNEIEIPESAISSALQELGAAKKPDVKKKGFLKHLDRAGATLQECAVQLTNILRNSENDGTRLKAIQTILAANDIQLEPEQQNSGPQIQIVLHSPETDKFERMLNPQR